jgi:hypothetical protein
MTELLCLLPSVAVGEGGCRILTRDGWECCFLLKCLGLTNLYLLSVFYVGTRIAEDDTAGLVIWRPVNLEQKAFDCFG